MNFNATILGQAISFALFVLFCMKKVWPIIINAIDKRQSEISESFALIERLKQDIERAQANVVKQLEKANTEAKIIVEQANKRSEKILNIAKTKAEQISAKIISQAQEQIDIERKRVYDDLRKQIAMLAVSIAEKIIKHSVNEAINNDIIDKFISEI